MHVVDHLAIAIMHNYKLFTLALEIFIMHIATHVHKGKLLKYVLQELLTHAQILMYNYLLYVQHVYYIIICTYLIMAKC